MIYWTTIFEHQKCSGEVSDLTAVPEGYRNPPVEDMGHMGHGREANQPTRGWCAPHKGGGRIGLGKGGATPVSFSSSLSFPLSTSVRRKKRGGCRPLLVQFGQAHGWARCLPFWAFSPFHSSPLRPITSPANSRNSPVFRKIPES